MSIPHPYEIIQWRGHTFDNITKAAVQAGERKLHKTATVLQGPWNPGGVAASAGAHDKSGAVDLWVDGLTVNAALHGWKDVGLCIWHRTAVPNLWDEHTHGVLRGDDRMSPVADAQVPDFDAHLDGLVDNAPDPSYRPQPKVTFDYEQWCRDQNLRRRIAQTTRDIHHLIAKRRKAKRHLHSHH